VLPAGRGTSGHLVTVRELGGDRETFARRYQLSARESEVVALVLRGYSNQDIATTLDFSLATAKKHLTHIFDKVGVDSRAQLISRLV
jgi:DNA-binding CsgD family transcriptional regulator